MSRPSDASIAKAFWRQREQLGLSEFTESVWDAAELFDAEAAAPPPFERCPKCTAHLPPGKHCAGASCPLRK